MKVSRRIISLVVSVILQKKISHWM